MSRDWTPRELHRADILRFNETGTYLHDASLVWKVNGVEKDIGCKRNASLYEKYPNLCFLLGVNYLEDINKDVSSAEETLSSILLSDDNNEVIKDSIIAKWYKGQLVPGYYMDDNNRFFAEYLKGNMIHISDPDYSDCSNC